MSKSAMELLVDAVHAKMVASDLPHFFGNRFRSQHDDWHRIIWVPRKGRLGAPGRLAHEHQSKPGYTITPIYSNRLTLDCFISAATMAELESLWADVLTATRTVLGTASEPIDYMITTEDDESGVTAGDYAQIVQRFEWDMTLAHVSGLKTDPTVWARPRTVAIAANTTFDLDVP